MPTRIEDVIVPAVFDPYMMTETMEQATVFNSGLVQVNGDIAAKLQNGGKLFTTPAWNDLSDNSGSNVGSDNPAQELPTDKIGTYDMDWRRQVRTKGWSTMDLTKELAGDDPLQAIIRRVGKWWA